jgi:hypothetical protein
MDLHNLGFSQGFQWIDGSFVEDVESSQARDPSDIDVVTFVNTPGSMTPSDVANLLHTHPNLLDPIQAKARYGCDAYLVRLDGLPGRLVRRTAYYFGLFSHRRSDNVWKGMLSMSLQSDDAAALSYLRDLAEGDAHAAAT